jgi:probable HAF family extracellular repeat protein
MDMRVIPAFATTVSVGVLLMAAPPTNAADYTFNSIDAPGAIQTTPFGINDAGQIVGFFVDSTRVVHGFLFAGERCSKRSDELADRFLRKHRCFTALDVPGAVTTEARGINNAGQIVGFFEETAMGVVQQHGFLYSRGRFTQFDVPGASATAAADINNAGRRDDFQDDQSGRAGRVAVRHREGQITGSFSTVTQGHGFLLAEGSFTTFDVPGAVSTSASGINDRGQIVGEFNTPANPTQRRHGFLRDTSGGLTTIDVPGATDTTANGINNLGQIVGTGTVVVGQQEHGFFRDTTGTFTQLDVPGTMRTDANGINNAGQIVGAFIDSAGIHGFLATPQIFAGTVGKANCYGQSVSALVRQYQGLNAAAAALEFSNIKALQNAILAFCEGSKV